MEIFLIGAWCIWTQRNEVIFDGKPPHLEAWRQILRHWFWSIFAVSSQVFILRSKLA
jgi:hypothetical protein